MRFPGSFQIVAVALITSTGLCANAAAQSEDAQTPAAAARTKSPAHSRSLTASANTASDDGSYVPPELVHPITSLPKPPGDVEVTAAGSSDPHLSSAAQRPLEPSAMVFASATSPAPAAPASAPAVPVAAEPVSAPAESSSANTAAVADPQPQPANVEIPQPELHAGLFAPTGAAAHVQALESGTPHVRPFSAIGIELSAGFGGGGLDIAVPLGNRVNARVGVSYFQYSGSYLIDGITANGEVKFRAGRASLDLYPFKGRTFRISPGFTVYNGNNLNASAIVPGGQNFDLSDQTYTSSVNDPVTGSASMTFGKRQAPNLTIGWGNLIQGRGHHLSIPFEIGAEYIGDPMISLYLQGTACSTETGVYACGQLRTDPIAQENIRLEEQKLNNDIHPLRFYPIVSIGVGWTFNFSRR